MLRTDDSGNIALDSVPDGLRYAVIFAADCEPDAIAAHNPDDTTESFTALSVTLGDKAAWLGTIARACGRDFYPVAYVEQAAQYFNRYPNATLAQLMEAGQLESDSIAGLYQP